MVAVTGVRAQELIFEVLSRLDAVLPAGRHVAMTRHAKWLTLEHREPFTPEGGGGYYSTSIRGLGAWIPFLPARVSSRLAAQQAVESVLDVAYAGGQGWKPGSIDFAVLAKVDGDSVNVSYRPPEMVAADERVQLTIPLGLL